jgi:hypothetical protein
MLVRKKYLHARKRQWPGRYSTARAKLPFLNVNRRRDQRVAGEVPVGRMPPGAPLGAEPVVVGFGAS